MTFRLQSGETNHFFNPFSGIRHFIYPGDIPEIFTDIHVQIQGIVFREIPDGCPDFRIFSRYLLAIDKDFPLVRPQKSSNHPHGRCLTGTIWTQKTENLTLAYLEGDITDSGLSAKRFGEVGNSYSQNTGVFQSKFSRENKANQ